MSVSRRGFLTGVAAGVGGLAAGVGATGPTVAAGAEGSRRSVGDARAARKVPRHRELIGHSHHGRAIYAYRFGPADAASRFLVVGQMHGDEMAGCFVVRHYLFDLAPPRGVQFWIVPTINPDGRAAGRRTNARGVDLNRNFATSDWHQHSKGTAYWSGPHPASEPETRAMQRFLTRLGPYTLVSMHQPLACVDFSGGDPAVTRWLAQRLGLPARRLGTSGGNMTTFVNQNWPRHTAVTLELPRPATPAFQRRTATVLHNLAIARRH
jgi:protein MpaA